MKPHILYIFRTRSTTNIAMIWQPGIIETFQTFLKSLLHSLEASRSALRIFSIFFTKSFVAFKMSASNFHYIIQGTMARTPSRPPDEEGFSSSLMGVSD